MADDKLPKYLRRLDATEKISVGLEGERILETVENALLSIDELLQNPDFGTSREKLVSDLKKMLASGLIALKRVTLPLPNSAIPDLTFSIDLRKRNVSVQSNKFKKKRAMLNSVLRTF